MDANLTNPIYHDTEKARRYLEGVRWPDGPICPHCGVVGEGMTLVQGKKQSHRPGLYHCNNCAKQFTVTVGTVYEASHIPLHKWLLATHLLTSSKKGISAHQLHRMLGITYKSAWFMAHRIREGMREFSPAPLGGEGKVIEADETYIGGKEHNKHAAKRRRYGKKGVMGSVDKEPVAALVERDGRVRSFHLPTVTARNLREMLDTNSDRASVLMTDELGLYKAVGREFARHGRVRHGAGQYVMGDAHTNTIEGFFSILKRGIYGTYHHVSPAHLKRYLAEFDFRYNERSGLGIEDAERATKALQGIGGKRLTYRRTDQRSDK
jgi:transposase-like protein